MRRFNHISASVDRITIEVGNSSSPLPSADVYWLDGFEPSGEYTDNRAVFIEARPRQIRCVSEGGFPLPEMRLYVGEREVTKMFSQSNSVTLDGERGLRQIHYRIERSTSYLSFSALDDEQPIRCVVTVSGFPANQTHLIVNVIRKQTCYLLFKYAINRIKCVDGSTCPGWGVEGSDPIMPRHILHRNTMDILCFNYTNVVQCWYIRSKI